MSPPRSTGAAVLLILPLLTAAGAAGQAAGGRGVAPAVVAFVDVTVIPMDREVVLTRQTVLVRGGKIAAVGPVRSVPVPARALRIDGRGRWLVPGLAEMHAHIPGGGMPAQVLEDLLFLYVANGVTTIRGMLGAPNQLRLREQTARGELLGPTIFVGAPSLGGGTVSTPEEAVRLVRAHREAGYDFLKIHPGLKRPVYDAIVATARAVGITWAGHIGPEVGLDRTLEAGQSTIDHMDGYLEAAVPDALKARLLAGAQVPFGEFVRAIDPGKFRRLAARSREAGVWNVPTVIVWENLNSFEDPQRMAARPELKYVSRPQLAAYVESKRNRIAQDRQASITAEEREAFLALRRRLLAALAQERALVLLGTDTPQLFNVPGFSILREVTAMQEAGFTPMQILQAGTRNVARYAAEQLKLDGRFGAVAAGNRADLILLEANPLEDITNIGQRVGVMVRGRWLPESELKARLDALSTRYTAAAGQP